MNLIGVFDFRHSKIDRQIINQKIVDFYDCCIHIKYFSYEDVLSEQYLDEINTIFCIITEGFPDVSFFELWKKNKITIHFIRDINALRFIDFGDLILKKDPKDFSLEQNDILSKIDLASYDNKKILITGAGGSIGQSLCHFFLSHTQAQIIALGRGENSIHKLWNQFQHESRFSFVIGDIIDESSFARTIFTTQPDIIIHTAAHKHVFMMEQYPLEALKNNVYSLFSMLKVLKQYSSLERFLYISTDKAVEPTSIMGKTKNIAECIFLSSETHFQKQILRLGNVIGSRGSILPIIKENLEMGKRIEITDMRMQRYFISQVSIAYFIAFIGQIQQEGMFVMIPKKQYFVFDLIEEFFKFLNIPLESVAFFLSGMRAGEKLSEKLLPDHVQSVEISDSIFALNPIPELILSEKQLQLMKKELHNLLYEKENKSNLDAFLNKFTI